MEIEWKQEYELGIEKIDEQHQRFFEFVRGLTEETDGDDVKQTVQDKMTFLRKYALEHFDDEEHLMARHKYPGTPEHCQLHVDFIKEYTRLMKELDAGEPRASDIEKIRDLAHDWLKSHITGQDVLYAEFVKKQQAAGEDS